MADDYDKIPCDEDFELKIIQREHFYLRKNKLQVTLFQNYTKTDCVSPEFVIDDKVIVKFLGRQHRHINNNSLFTTICVSCKEMHADDQATYIIHLSCTGDFECNGQFTCDKDKLYWREIFANNGRTIPFQFTVNIKIEQQVGSLIVARLHDDEEFTDFELRAEDGSIRVHRAVVATASPVFKRMFCSTWKETTHGVVDIPGITKSTLQHLKAYLYQDRLPETGLEQLMLLASCYMIEGLEEKCVKAIAQSLTPERVLQTCEFAVQNKANKLMIAVIETFQNHQILVKNVEKYCV